MFRRRQLSAVVLLYVVCCHHGQQAVAQGSKPRDRPVGRPVLFLPHNDATSVRPLKLDRPVAPLPAPVPTLAQHGIDHDSTTNESETSPELFPLIARGRQAFFASCTECHEAERAFAEEKSLSEWLDTIREMSEKEDADIDPEDFRSIALFLVARGPDQEPSDTPGDGGPDEKKEASDSEQQPKFDQALVARGESAFDRSCTKCHDADRSYSKRKSLAGWRATVRRMAAKDGAEVNASDIDAIATYLTSRSSGDGEGGEDAASDEIVSPWTFSATLSTLRRDSSDTIENPGFFVDAWVGADYQSDGPLRATVMACTSCHSDQNSSRGFTFELVEASATLDIRKFLIGLIEDKTKTKFKSHTHPCIARTAEIKAGRFVLPFGAYSAISHPGAYRTVTNPLMYNMGRRLSFGGAFQPVLPAPYTDEGANLSLGWSEWCDRSYTLDLFVVNGLQGNQNGTNFNLSRSYTDNNREPAVGGRVTMGNPKLRIGASAMSGTMENDGRDRLDYHLVGADVTVRIQDRLRLLVEYASRREGISNLADNQIDGIVVENELKLRDNLGLLLRYDTLEHELVGTGNQIIERFTWGLNFTLPKAGLVMLNHEHWILPDTMRDVDVIGTRWVTSF